MGELSRADEFETPPTDQPHLHLCPGEPCHTAERGDRPPQRLLRNDWLVCSKGRTFRYLEYRSALAAGCKTGRLCSTR
jgi:hypothetical protein